MLFNSFRGSNETLARRRFRPRFYPSRPLGAGLNFGAGFADASVVLQFNGSAVVAGQTIELTRGRFGEAGSVFSTDRVSVAQFRSQFTFQVSPGPNMAQGITFTIQRAGPTTLGASGGGLGYGADRYGRGGIPSSVAIKFDLHNTADEGHGSTGLYVNGAAPTDRGAIDLSKAGIDLRSGAPLQVSMVYNGYALVVTIKDPTLGKAATQAYVVDIPSIVGGDRAFVGFTGATASPGAKQSIHRWTFNPGSPDPATEFPFQRGR